MPTITACTSQDEHQCRVDAYFQSTAVDWSSIYSEKNVYAVIHQQRQELVLQMVDKLHLPPGSEVLDIGCGTGVITLALARRGYRVHAADTVYEMLSLTRQRIAESKLGDSVTIAPADINNLSYPRNRFDLVIAIGVLPWLSSIDHPIREVARITKNNGYLITNVDNRWRLNEVLDPRFNPLHAPVRKKLRPLRQKQTPETQRCSTREFDAILQNSGYTTLETVTVGFGPFTFFGHELLPNPFGVRVHNFLQRLADRNTPLFRSTGAQYVFLAGKRSSLQ